MALKFLNKKGWHTGSLRNIENVWKAEQKHDAEQKKLEELKKQIHEERERSEFRLLQQQAGLVPKQERLDFLYDSGLAVGKGKGDSDSGFKALEPLPKTDPSEIASSSSTKQQQSVPGSLFEDKPQSANDSWRKLHSDPLLLIRQREQEALARVKNNPVQMAMIRKSVEEKKQKEKASKGKKHVEKHHHKKKHQKHSIPTTHVDNVSTKAEEKRSHSYRKNSKHNESSNSEDEYYDMDVRSKKYSDKDSMHEKNVPPRRGRHDDDDDEYQRERPHREDGADMDVRSKKYSDKDSMHEKNVPPRRGRHDDDDGYQRERPHREDGADMDVRSKKYSDKDSMHEKNVPRWRGRHDDDDEYQLERPHREDGVAKKTREDRKRGPSSPYHRSPDLVSRQEPRRKHQTKASGKISEEERAARLKEMQMDAELHEEQRWKRIKKAEEEDAKEAADTHVSGRNFLDAAHKSVYGAEKGGSSTIEESVRRRTHFSQRRTQDGEGNAFRR